MLFSPAVVCALLACCWQCSSRLLLAMLFCDFVPLSEILVDLLLVVVKVLRLCAPFRQSDFASFVDFFSSLGLLAVMLSLFSVFWRRLLQHYFVVVSCFNFRLKHLQCHCAPLCHFVIFGSWLGARAPQHRSLQQRGLLCVRVWLHSVWSGRFVASAVRLWSPTPLCDTLNFVHLLSEGFQRGFRPRRGPLFRPRLL